jgi:hypothetical protein
MYEGEDNKYVVEYPTRVQIFISLLRGVASALCIGLAETIHKIGPAILEHCQSLCHHFKEPPNWLPHRLR